MYDSSRTGTAEPTYASTMSALPGASQPAVPGTRQATRPPALEAGRRPVAGYASMGGAENGLFAPNGTLRRQLAMLGGLFQLPTSLQGYLVFTFCLLILAFTMVLHITLSAEIMRLDDELILLKSEHQTTEHKNAGLIYEIARYSSLQDVNRKAVLAGYVPATKAQFVVQRQDVVDALDNPAPKDLTPEYLILGGDLAAPTNPVVVLENAPAESATESNFWSYLRWQNVRDALAETGSWLRSWLPARGTP